MDTEYSCILQVKLDTLLEGRSARSVEIDTETHVHVSWCALREHPEVSVMLKNRCFFVQAKLNERLSL